MQRVQFRLDRVLEWRRKQCGMEENRLAACLIHVQDTERKTEALRAERTAIDRELLTRQAIPAVDFLNLGRYRGRRQGAAPGPDPHQRPLWRRTGRS